LCVFAVRDYNETPDPWTWAAGLGKGHALIIFLLMKYERKRACCERLFSFFISIFGSVKNLLKYILFFVSIWILPTANAQVRVLPKKPNLGGNEVKLDSLAKNMKRSKRSKVVYKVEDYKFFDLKNDSLVVDTMLNIRSFYKSNDLLKDDLERLAFSNLGLGYTDLSLINNEGFGDLPKFVAGQKSVYYRLPSDVNFFKVPSAYSDLYYINGIGQGQMLRAFVTTNINPQLNFSLGYRGISSLGLYKNSTTSSGRLQTAWNYQSSNENYGLKFVYLAQDIQNDENGGIKDRNQFENGGETFKDRSRIDVNFTDAKSLLKGSQVFLYQEFRPFKKAGVKLINETFYHQRKFKYEQQKAANDFFGPSFVASDIKDSLNLKQFYNLTAVGFQYKKFDIQTGIKYLYNRYFADSTKVVQGQSIPGEIKFNDFSWTSHLDFDWRKLGFDADLSVIPTEKLQGYKFAVEMRYRPDSITDIKGKFVSSSTRPDFKYLMFQSAYEHLNWYRPDLKNELTQEISAVASRRKWGSLDFKQVLINNYTYFSASDTLPAQTAQGVLMSSVKYSNDFGYGKFGFSPDILLQKVIKGSEVLSLPAYVVRGSLYYSNRYFNRNLFVQAGITAKYFEAFYAPYYHPVLGDFVVQREEKIGGFPLLDVFVNFKVKRFRFYFKAEHINGLWEYKKPKYYVAPGYPYRDFLIRFGINWVFFN